MTRVAQLTDRVFDVLIVGAGIHGATTACAAARAGLSVALIDKGDFGEGASANSLKILHGGLRYLQQANLPRMRESIWARRDGLRALPYCARPASFLAPVGTSLKRSRAAYTVAAALNDLVGFDRNRGVPPAQHLHRTRVLSADEVNRLLPIADIAPRGALNWSDGLIENTERYTLAYVFSAREAGAVIANYIKAETPLYHEGRLTGVTACDAETGERFDLRARVTVNTSSGWTGDWLPALRRPWLRAINYIVDKTWFGPLGVGLDNGERNFFFVPWRGRTMIGTTYDRYDDRPDELAVTEHDHHVFCSSVNQLFPAAELQPGDITYVHAGLLPAKLDRRGNPLLHADDHTDLVETQPGLITLQGVKYTTAVYWAAKLVPRLAACVGKAVCSPSDAPLYGAEPGNETGALAGLYGARASELRKMIAADPAQGEQIPGTPYPAAVVQHAVKREQARHLLDVLLRRTDIGTAARPSLPTVHVVAAHMAACCSWTTERTGEEHQRVRAHYEHLGLC